MDIPFVQRSDFLGACRDAVSRQRRKLATGGVVRVELTPGGYDGRVRVALQGGDRVHFRAAWGTDPSRFPQRIRAAATALRDEGEYGMFEITHADGLLQIQRLDEVDAEHEA